MRYDMRYLVLGTALVPVPLLISLMLTGTGAES